MSIRRPDSLHPLTIAVAQAATIGGMLYSVGMVTTGLGLLPGVGLGTGMMMTELGSGLLLGGVSLAGNLCAQTAAKVRRINTEQVEAIREAEKTGVMPDANPYRLLDAGMERSPLAFDVARVGGVIFGLIGAIGLAGAAVAAVPVSPLMLATYATSLAVGTATYRASRVAEDAVAYAEEKTRDASRVLRNATPATEWAQAPTAMVGTEFTYPPAGHFVNKYLEQQAVREVALLEDMRGR